MANVDLSDVKKVRTIAGSAHDVNAHLKLGWTLIGVFQGKDEERADPVFVIGWSKGGKPENPDGWN